MPTSPAEVDSLHAELQRRLVESGEWDRIKAALTVKLNENGWLDDLRHKTKAHAKIMDPPSFQQLFEDFSTNSQSNLPLAVKRDVMSQIRQYLEKQIA